MADLTHAAAIVGIHEHVTRYAPDKSELQIQGESVIKALEDAGLSKQDVDGLLTASSSIRNSGLNLADYLNMYPKFVDNTTVGGGSFEFHLSHALNAIAAGRIGCAVIAYGSLARSGGVSVGTGGVARLGHPTLEPSPDSFEELYRLTTVGLYAMIAQRHMHLYGTTSEQLAEIAVAIRHHASMNPEALFRNPITVEEVAPWWWPLPKWPGTAATRQCGCWVPGMRGIFLLLEATRQLRRQFEGTPRQVPDCNIAICHGTGGALGSRHSGGTVILGRD